MTKGLLFLFQCKRLSPQEVKDIFDMHQYGTTNIKGFGEAIIVINNYSVAPSSGTVTVGFTMYTPEGLSSAVVPATDLVGWTPYTGPIPPYSSTLPGGMGGQGWGQGQAFPSQGGQGPGSWGTWGGF
jgi:hypothetical protein